MRIEKSLSKHLSKSLSKSLAGGDTPTPPTVISAIKLTFRPDLRTNVFQHLSSGAGGAGEDLEVSYDDGHTWSECGTGHGVSGGTWTELYIRGKCGSNPIAGLCGNFVKVEGNVMTLVDWENPAAAELAANQFYSTSGNRGLFQSYDSYQANFTDASELVLPATTLATSCYRSMFEGCTALTYAPNLPATTLATGCYERMFFGCSSLTSAMATLPATTLVAECYIHMFNQCGSLTTAPTLPATTLANYCYYQMFASCSSLNEIHCSATDITATGCTGYWTLGVAASGTFYRNEDTWAGWTTGYDGIPTGWTVVPPQPWVGLTFTSTGTSTVYLDNIGGNNPNCEYSTNSGSTWVTFPTTGPALQFTGSLWVRGVNASGFSTSDSAYSVFVFNGSSINASGSVMSLIDGVGDSLVIPNDYCFYSLFKNCLQLTSAPALPATTLTFRCYKQMFRDCGGLTSTPNLPASTLASYCYEEMFYNCIDLTTATALNATTLADSCYRAMFRSCTSLVTAPTISAETLAVNCCWQMFQSCTSLTTVSLPATTLAGYCYFNMFWGCTSLTTPPELPATTLAQHCYEWMFESCTALTSTPVLNAETLVTSCYSNMFNGCSSLNEVHCNATDISASGCTDNWLSGVAASGDFYGKSAAGWTSGASGIPTGWTAHYPFTDFQEVQYLQSTGTQYIDTGVQTSSEQEVSIKYCFTDWSASDYDKLFGGYKPDYGYFIQHDVGTNNAKIVFGYNFNSRDSYTFTTAKGTVHEVTMRSGGGVLDGVEFTIANRPSFSFTNTVYLFALCSNGSVVQKSQAKIYSCTISNNGVVLRNFIPCYRKSDSVPGMYDTVGGAFYQNAGTGSFITGPDVNA